MKLSKLILICAMTLSSTLYSAEIMAPAATSSAHFDVFLGASTPTGDMSDLLSTRFGYGAQLLFNLAPDLGIGAFYSTNKGSIDNFDAIEVGMSYYGLVGQLNLNPTFFLQGRAGFSSLEVTATDSSTGQTASIKANKHPFIIAGGLGANLPIANNISFAPFVSYTHSFKTASGTEDEIDSYGLFEVMAAVRFNF